MSKKFILPLPIFQFEKEQQRSLEEFSDRIREDELSEEDFARAKAYEAQIRPSYSPIPEEEYVSKATEAMRKEKTRALVVCCEDYAPETVPGGIVLLPSEAAKMGLISEHTHTFKESTSRLKRLNL